MWNDLVPMKLLSSLIVLDIRNLRRKVQNLASFECFLSRQPSFGLFGIKPAVHNNSLSFKSKYFETNCRTSGSRAMSVKQRRSEN